MLKVVVSAALLVVCSSAVAQTPPAQLLDQGQTQAAAAKAKNRVVCQDVGEIGSRLASHRVCMTAEQWKQQEQAEKDSLAEQQRRSTQPN